MQRFTFSVGATGRRRMMVHVTKTPHAMGMRLSGATVPAQFLQQHWYTQNHGGYPQGMPPPPMGYSQYPPPPMQHAPVYYAPPQSAAQGPELGTRERPLVVAALPQPRSLMSKLWMFLVAVIGLSALLHLVEEIDLRTSGGENTGKVGGLGNQRIASMFGVQEVKPVDLDQQQVTFADIQGVDEAKQELEDIVLFLKDPSRFTELGARLPRGALLVGPPGCGKTMLAKAIAKEAGVKFYYCSGSEFDEMFVGVGSRRVRELFAAAKSTGPSLIFIDEIDALGGKRTSKDHSYSRMTLNQLLAEMDGFQSSDAVIVLAATNTPDALDKALTRPGRFDTTVSVDPPDLKGRAAILTTYLEKIKHDATVLALEIAKGTSGMTGAELSNLVNVAAIRAAVLEKKEVSWDEIEYAKDRVMMGAENRSKIVPEEERRITAYHEGGHALIAILNEKNGADPVHKATIVPRGSGIMGLVQQQPDKDRYSQSKRQMLTRLQVCLGGRIAEEILLGTEDVTSGASSDFQQATYMARAMVRRFGFNTSLGTIDYETAETSEGAFFSDSTKEKIEQEVRNVMEQSYTDAKQLLLDHRAELDAIAKQLLLHETLTGDQLKEILAGKTIEFKPKILRPGEKSVNSPKPKPPSGGQVLTAGTLEVTGKPAAEKTKTPNVV